LEEEVKHHLRIHDRGEEWRSEIQLGLSPQTEEIQCIVVGREGGVFKGMGGGLGWLSLIDVVGATGAGKKELLKLAKPPESQVWESGRVNYP